MRFSPPYALGIDEWDDFYKKFKAEAPIRYFLAKTLVETVLWPIERRKKAIQGYFRYRCIPRHRYHVMSTGEAPGYSDLDHRLLHVNFNALKDFVEIEKGWQYFWCHSDERPSWLSGVFGRQRYAEKGIEYLEWESSLSDPNSPNFQGSINDHQAIHAREVLGLYAWWTDERPNRVEPEFPSMPGAGDEPLAMLSDKIDRTTPEYAAYEAEVKRVQNIEEEWSNEDTDMLIRLMKARKGLWT